MLAVPGIARHCNGLHIKHLCLLYCLYVVLHHTLLYAIRVRSLYVYIHLVTNSYISLHTLTLNGV